MSRRTAFASQSEAKRFFAERIAAQAVAEGRPLSDGERRMLDFSESDPEHPVDRELVDRLAAEIADEEYEAKMAGLLEPAYAGDVARDGAACETNRRAHTALEAGDHYVLIMIDRALGRHPRPRWAFWR